MLEIICSVRHCVEMPLCLALCWLNTAEELKILFISRYLYSLLFISAMCHLRWAKRFIPEQKNVQILIGMCRRRVKGLLSDGLPNRFSIACRCFIKTPDYRRRCSSQEPHESSLRGPLGTGGATCGARERHSITLGGGGGVELGGVTPLSSSQDLRAPAVHNLSR